MTLKQYSQIQGLPEGLTETERSIHIAAILTETTPESLTALPIAEMLAIIRSVKFPEAGTPVTEFEWQGRKYRIAESFDDLSFYQFSDMSDYFEQGDLAAAFTVATFTRAEYQIGQRLMDEFAARKTAFESMPDTIWFSALHELVKKKQYQIISQLDSSTRQAEKEILQDSSATLIESLDFLRLQKPLRPDRLNFTHFFTTRVFLPFTIWVLKRLKPVARIELVNLLLKKIPFNEIYRIS